MISFQKIRETIERADMFSIERMRFAAIAAGVFIFAIVLRGMMFPSHAHKDAFAAAQPALVAESMPPPAVTDAAQHLSVSQNSGGGDESVFTENDVMPASVATSTERGAEAPHQQPLPLFAQTTASSSDAVPALFADAYIVARGMMPVEMAYAKNIHERRAPASVTKLMTAVVVAEQIPADTPITITAHAVATEGVAGYLRAGEQFRAADLMKIMLIVSSNDAAAAFADYFVENGDDLVARMNAKAKELGMGDTHFVNVSGLDDAEHYTSAFDLAVLASYSLRHENIWNILSEKADIVYSLKEKRPRALLSNNPIIQKHLEGVRGSKTGYTKNARGCMITALETGEVIVVLGSDDRTGDTEKLIQLITNN